MLTVRCMHDRATLYNSCRQHANESTTKTKTAEVSMRGSVLCSAAIFVGACGGSAIAASPAQAGAGLEMIQNIVVIYAENRSFDNLYGFFPGANGLQDISTSTAKSLQRDRDGSVFKELPPVWG